LISSRLAVAAVLRLVNQIATTVGGVRASSEIKRRG
jgi:hypothetical protein